MQTLTVKQGIKPFLISFSALLLASVLILFVYFQQGYQRELTDLKTSERASLRIISNYIHDALALVHTDLKYFGDVIEFHMESLLSEKKSNIEGNFIFFSQRKEVYDQIRFIDSAGDERVRINRNNYGSEAVPEGFLQNKRDRYYFTSAMALEKGGVYLSPLDLNVEQGRVEIPFKPMLRFGSPVFDSEGRKRGIVMLNYLAENFLQVLQNRHGEYGGSLHFLCNSEGYWLFHNGHNDLEFLFMFPEQDQKKLFNLYPEAAESVYSSDSGVIETGMGLFIWNTIYPERLLQAGSRVPETIQKEEDSYCWKNISFTHRDQLNKIRSAMFLSTFRFFPLILVFLLFISLFIAFIVGKNSNYRDHIHHMAHYDALTSLYNRHFFMEMAAKSLEITKRKKEHAALLFLDLDGFKPVNDTYGHEAGDEVLKVIAARLVKTLRQSDLTARFGGDEFVILLYGHKNSLHLGRIISKVRSEIEKPVPFGRHVLSVGCSVGSAVYPDDGSSIETLIETADSGMYVDKRERKKNRPR